MLEKAKQAYKDDQYSECIRLCELILEQDPKSKTEQVLTLHLLADALLDLEQYRKAINVFDKILSVESSDIAYANRGFAYMGLKEWDRALRDYSEAILVNPDNLLAMGFVAECHLKLNRTDVAISFLLNAIEKKPSGGRLYAILGDAYGSKGAWPDAYRAYCRAVDLDPADSVSRRALLEIEKSVGGSESRG